MYLYRLYCLPNCLLCNWVWWYVITTNTRWNILWRVLVAISEIKVTTDLKIHGGCACVWPVVSELLNLHAQCLEWYITGHGHRKDLNLDSFYFRSFWTDCTSVGVCVSLTSDSSETINFKVVIKLGTVIASDMVMHHMLIILTLIFIQLQGYRS